MRSARRATALSLTLPRGERETGSRDDLHERLVLVLDDPHVVDRFLAATEPGTQVPRVLRPRHQPHRRLDVARPHIRVELELGREPARVLHPAEPRVVASEREAHPLIEGNRWLDALDELAHVLDPRVRALFGILELR